MHPCVILFVSVVPVVTGYWLAGRIPSIRAPERLAVASLAGLGVLLLCVSIVNFFAPLSGWRAWICLLPATATLCRRSQLAGLGSDLAAILCSRRALLTAASAVAMLAILAWPELTQKGLIYYDGTSNHDGYFWISGAHYLQRHGYMEVPVVRHDRPWASSCHAFAGWNPTWGRAGSEGLLALVAALSSSDAAGTYLPTTAALLVPWIAAVFLVVRTFWSGGLTAPGLAALLALQPIFIFFRANGNLPNLLGALAGAGVVVATARSLDARAARGPWLALLALSVHGCLYAYPEIFPFLALPCALLAARAARCTPSAVPGALLAGLAGVAVNPATAIRAWHGFFNSFLVARADHDWVNTFATLGPSQYLPALATVSVQMAHYLGAGACGAASLAMLAAAGLALARAKDRFGAAASLSGGALLAVYTVATHFSYGWLKTALFAGVFISALLPVAAIDTCWRAGSRGRRLLPRALAAGVALLLATGVAFQAMDLQKWSRRKFLTRDWPALRSAAAEKLDGAPVVIDPATFPMAFFDGMWAAYFLPDNDLSYAARGTGNGGYLRGDVRTERDPQLAPTRAALVSLEWAGTFDSNSTRLFSSESAVLLRSANRVTRLEGFLPVNGLPETAGDRIAIALVPHSRSSLGFSLAPTGGCLDAPRSWRVTRGAPGAPPFLCEIAGPPPWRIVVPLEPGQINQIEVGTSSAPSGGPRRFAVSGISVVDQR